LLVPKRRLIAQYKRGWVLAGARSHPSDWEQAHEEPVFRPDTRGGDFSDTADYIRRYYDENPAA
jgi:hypothetical protein